MPCDAFVTPLSVLDVAPVVSGGSPSQALHSTLALARAADGLGLHRFWVAEHHNSPVIASTSPAVLTGAVAAATERIRVGAGGVMLPNHPPLAVAEAFRTLEALYPGRIDLGLGRAPGTDHRTAMALHRNASGIDDQVAELRGFALGPEPGHAFAGITAQPGDVDLPPLWVLGSTGFGAQVAATLGTGFAHAGHFGTADPVEVLGGYRRGFVPSSSRARPHAILTVSVVVGGTAARAAELDAAAELASVWARLGRQVPFPSPAEAAEHRWTLAERNTRNRPGPSRVVGTSVEVVAELAALQARTGADELMLVLPVHDHEEKVTGLTSLAREWARQAVA